MLDITLFVFQVALEADKLDLWEEEKRGGLNNAPPNNTNKNKPKQT